MICPFPEIYSYDYTTSARTNAATHGSYKISLQCCLFLKYKPENFLSCPAFGF